MYTKVVLHKQVDLSHLNSLLLKVLLLKVVLPWFTETNNFCFCVNYLLPPVMCSYLRPANMFGPITDQYSNTTLV